MTTISLWWSSFRNDDKGRYMRTDIATCTPSEPIFWTCLLQPSHFHVAGWILDYWPAWHTSRLASKRGKKWHRNHRTRLFHRTWLFRSWERTIIRMAGGVKKYKTPWTNKWWGSVCSGSFARYFTYISLILPEERRSKQDKFQLVVSDCHICEHRIATNRTRARIDDGGIANQYPRFFWINIYGSNRNPWNRTCAHSSWQNVASQPVPNMCGNQKFVNVFLTCRWFWQIQHECIGCTTTKCSAFFCYYKMKNITLSGSENNSKPVLQNPTHLKF